MLANIINCHLKNIITSELNRNYFSNSARVASIRPLFKWRGKRTEIKCYRPVSILNCLSNVYERFVHEQLALSMNQFLSVFINANHALLKIIGIWKAATDTNLFTGAVLIGLSKAFDCISHNLLTANLLTTNS